MNQQNHQQYYVARAATSRELAQMAASPSIAAIHSELASRYDVLAAQLEGKNDGSVATFMLPDADDGGDSFRRSQQY